LGIETIISNFAQQDSTTRSSSSATAPEGTESTPPSQSTSTPAESIAEELERKISSLVAVRVQGSSETLSALMPIVADTIRLAIHHLEQRPETDENNKEEEKEEGKEVEKEVENRLESTPAPSSAHITSVWVAAAMSALSEYLDPVILGEKIKSLAERTSHGNKVKGVLMFEDMDPSAVWRWETMRYSNITVI
jgi:hypothetical protein